MTLNNKKINQLFYYWLLITFLLVFLMVMVGGLTRLTNSGLSITQWELFTGILPPLDLQTWDRYFSLYILFMDQLINFSTKYIHNLNYL